MKKISTKEQKGPSYKGGKMECTPNTSELLKKYGKDCNHGK